MDEDDANMMECASESKPEVAVGHQTSDYEKVDDASDNDAVNHHGGPSGFTKPFTVAYLGCIEDSERYLPILERYSIGAAAEAVFCILSWHQNRSAQGCAFAMNAALLRHSRSGEFVIKTYDEFVSLFQELKGVAHISPMEDVVLPVMGQTKVAFQGKWWKALYGCGMVREYPRLCFAETFCKVADRAGEYEQVLRYVENVTESLNGGGWNGEDEGDIDLYLPPESHWQLVKSWFGGAARGLSDEIVAMLSSDASPVEKRHFISVDENFLPLFNPSIMHDTLSALSKGITDTCSQGAIDAALVRQASASFPIDTRNRSGCIAYPLFRADGKLLENCPAAIFVFGEDPCETLFFNLVEGEGNLSALKNLFATRTERIDIIAPLASDNGPKVLSVPNPARCKINIVAYVDDLLLDQTPMVVEKADVADVTCGATDVMALFQIASSADELNAFFLCLKTTNCQFIRLHSGYSDLFCCWKGQNRQIAAGAEDADAPLNVVCDFNETDKYYVRLFRETLVDYPFIGGGYVLGSPFSRVFGRNVRGFLTGDRKVGGQPFGSCIRLGDKPASYLHLCVDLASLDVLGPEELEDESNFHPFIDDVFSYMTLDVRDELARLAQTLGGILHIEYVVETAAAKLNFHSICPYLGAKGALFNAPDGCPVIVFTLNKEKFFDAVVASPDRHVECDLASAVFSVLTAIGGGVFGDLREAIELLACGKKKVDVTSIELPFIWNPAVSRPSRSDLSRARAIKKVALAANGSDVQPGKYYGTNKARDLLRSFRGLLFEELRDELGRFEQGKLVAALYGFLADAMREFYIHSMRFGAFDQVEDTVLDRVDDDTFTLREGARVESHAAQCCIETVLAFELSGAEIPKPCDVANLISLADQYLSLSNLSDILSFEPKGLGVEIALNFTASLIEDSDIASRFRSMKKRQLKNPGHSGSPATDDARYIAQSKAAFEQDTGVAFDCFTSVLDTLALGIDDQSGWFVLQNVVEAERDDLDRLLVRELGDTFPAQQLSDCVTNLVLDASHIAYTDGEGKKYIPFGNTKTRPNRLELRPVIFRDNKLIFSPVAMGMLRKRWIAGIAERFIPAKGAFPELYKVLNEWKKLYEKSLEEDVRACFVDHGLDPKHVFRSLELKKYGNHPDYLGDYDGLAYDEARGIVWVIECKEYEKFDSAYDYMQVQQHLFGQGGRLLKFERRISYIKENLMTVLSDLGISPSVEPKIIPLLVSNKLFINMLGESSFEIVTLSELSSMLEDESLDIGVSGNTPRTEDNEAR